VPQRAGIVSAVGHTGSMARVTLQTIADRVGVSRMTVSNAFSRPDQLSAELRDRILEAATELGYAGPDPTARALARGTTGAVGVLLTDSLAYAFTDEVATGFLGAVVEELAPTGLAFTLLSSDAHGGVVPARDVAIDGALVYSCRPHSDARDWLVRRQLPLVFVDQDPVAGVPCVNVDDRGGARAAAQHLLDLGHRRIGIVALAPETAWPTEGDDTEVPHPTRQRRRGWADALEPAGITAQVVEAPTHSELDAEQVALELLQRADRPTAVLCYSDVLALGVIRAARQLGLAVPADVSVVGFDDSPVAHRHDPQLTTVRQDVTAKGRAAVAALTAAIDATNAGLDATAAHVLLPTELVVRASTAPPPD
jgi:DNA-binding LacI/PurR family transcriptional regulator